MSSEATTVLFVCLGNICRSPLAEGVFRHLVTERDLAEHYRIDSAGTGSWHIGEPPDRRAWQVAKSNGVRLEGRARQIQPGDLERFRWIVVMDRENLEHVQDMQRRRGGKARVHRLRDFDPDPGDGNVPDPYYGGPGGFERVYALVNRSAAALLEHLEQERSREGGGTA